MQPKKYNSILPKGYTSRDYARDKAFVDSVRAENWEGLIMANITSPDATDLRIKLLNKDSIYNLTGNGSLEEVAREGDSGRFLIAKMFRNRFMRKRSRVGTWKSRLEDESKEAEKTQARYEKVATEICYSGEGLSNMLLARDRLQRDLKEAAQMPLFPDAAELTDKAEDLDTKIKHIVDGCPKEVMPAIRAKIGYLLDKYCPETS